MINTASIFSAGFVSSAEGRFFYFLLVDGDGVAIGVSRRYGLGYISIAAIAWSLFFVDWISYSCARLPMAIWRDGWTIAGARYI